MSAYTSLPPNGASMIAAERQRQIAEEHWTPEHDQSHRQGQLAWAAACYAAPGVIFRREPTIGTVIVFRDPWPVGWRDKRNINREAPPPWNEPTVESRIRELTKAGALIAAEIDRLRGTLEKLLQEQAG